MASPEEMRALRMELNDARVETVREISAHNDTRYDLYLQRRDTQRLAETMNRRIQRLRKKNKKLRKKNRRLERSMNILRQTQDFLQGALTRICESIRAAFEAI
jgi:hypothetical protein